MKFISYENQPIVNLDKVFYITVAQYGNIRQNSIDYMVYFHHLNDDYITWTFNDKQSYETVLSKLNITAHITSFNKG